MAIQPPSDIVDAARAADPVEYRTCVEKLRDLRNTAHTQTVAHQENNFAQLVHADYTNLHNTTRTSTNTHKTAQRREQKY
ncbi:hypothetical protein ACOWKN_05560 [Helicobacter pylori]